jgi:hypothetical protein
MFVLPPQAAHPPACLPACPPPACQQKPLLPACCPTPAGLRSTSYLALSLESMLWCSKRASKPTHQPTNQPTHAPTSCRGWKLPFCLPNIIFCIPNHLFDHACHAYHLALLGVLSFPWVVGPLLYERERLESRSRMIYDDSCIALNAISGDE